MENLKSYGVQSLNAEEMREIDGGIVPLIVLGACLLLAGCGSTVKVTGSVEKGGTKVSGTVEVTTPAKK